MKEQSIQNPEPDSAEPTGEQEAPVEAPSTQRRGFTAWIQFPRRAVLLVGAYLLAILFLAALWQMETAPPELRRDSRLTAEAYPPWKYPPPLPFERAVLQLTPFERCIIAFQNFLAGDFEPSLYYRRSVSDIISERAPSTLTLLMGGIIASVLLTLVATAIAVSIHRSEGQAGMVGSILKRAGWSAVFRRGTMILFWLGLLVAWLCAFGFGLFPISGRVSSALWGGTAFSVNEIYSRIFVTGIVVAVLLLVALLVMQVLNRSIVPWGVQMAVALGIVLLPVGFWSFLAGNMTLYTRDILSHLILPCALVAVLPAILTTQALSRELTVNWERSDSARFRIEIYLKGLGVLFGQTAGWLGALVVVETVFFHPGLGSLLVVAVWVGDIPAAFGIVVTMAAIVLGGRLLGELFHWLARLVSAPSVAPMPEPTLARKTGRRTRVIVTASLLAIPILLFFAGGVVHPILLDTVLDSAVYDPVTGFDIAQARVPGAPGPGHPLGTDVLGRDILSQLMSGSSRTLITAVILTGVIASVALPWGALTGWFIERRTWWSETIADFLMLPLDALLILPIIPTLMLLAVTHDHLAIPFILCAGFLLAPRGVRVYQTLWAATPKDKKWRLRLLPGVGALLLGAAFMALYTILTLEFFGLANSRMSLGLMLYTAQASGFFVDFQRWWLTLPTVSIAWLCLFIFYAAADALVGYFPTKQALVRMNE